MLGKRGRRIGYVVLSFKARALTLLGTLSRMKKPNSNLKADKLKVNYRAVQLAMGRGVAAGGGST